jgi:oligopeptide/dipeptide ABC transporter ATP-binding protein
MTGAPHTPVLVEVKDLHLDFVGDSGTMEPILRGVDLTLHRGKVLGLVGESGSGKSMTARALVGLSPQGMRVSGSVRYLDRELIGADAEMLRQFRATNVGYVFQDPRSHLDPVRTIGDFLTEALTLNRGVSVSTARSRSVAMLSDVGIADAARRMRQFPHEMSGGMLQRVMIASALMAEPALLIADEPTTALDVTTQSELMAILAEAQRDRGLSVLFISHDLDLAAAICDQVAVMYAGQIVEDGVPSLLHQRPRHPYTAALIGSRPSLTSSTHRLVQIPGSPATASAVGTGCGFRARCLHRIQICDVESPPITSLAGSAVRCHRAHELDLSAEGS